ncbi:hypothetical protein ANANG_G00197990 [Anguilla anguilla]|uniref:Uncharacterized protein n=1 Tax=Anguilla anguilla TaxID=7936 RepID=A0A9D3RSI8_ANGAN|nr:hypothetical protein ANANG_G00197990 [Anguilla anguilla]
MSSICPLGSRLFMSAHLPLCAGGRSLQTRSHEGGARIGPGPLPAARGRGGGGGRGRGQPLQAGSTLEHRGVGAYEGGAGSGDGGGPPTGQLIVMFGAGIQNG